MGFVFSQNRTTLIYRIRGGRGAYVVVAWFMGARNWIRNNDHLHSVEVEGGIELYSVVVYLVINRDGGVQE